MIIYPVYFRSTLHKVLYNSTRSTNLQDYFNDISIRVQSSNLVQIEYCQYL